MFIKTDKQEISQFKAPNNLLNCIQVQRSRGLDRMQKRTVWSEITAPTKRLAEEQNTIKLLTHRKYRHESCSYKRKVELRGNWVNKFRVLAKFEN